MSSAPTPAPRRLWLYISLFLNVAFIAFVGFAAWRISMGPPEGHGRGPDGMKLLSPHQIEALAPASAKAKIRHIGEAHKAKFKSLFDTLRAGRDKLLAAAGTDPFDANALRSALSEMRPTEEALRAEVADVIIEALTAMTPDERKATLDKVKERIGSRSDNGPGHSPDDHGPDDDGPPPPPPEGAPPPPPGP